MMAKYNESSIVFLVWDDALLVKTKGGEISVPLAANVASCFTLDTLQYIGQLGGTDCYVATSDLSENAPTGFAFSKLRQMFGLLDSKVYQMALRALHIGNWLKNNRFCGRCGGQMRPSRQELAMRCSSCGYIVYPRISPAIIVAISKGSEILLARSNRFPPGRYSVIAGFLEAGETLEECVKREIKEEVGLEVHSIRYFGSQPWPFPDSEMIAFTAEYMSGAITIDHDEIVAAGWFSADKLPDIPPKDSIARRLIDAFVERTSTSRKTSDS